MDIAPREPQSHVEGYRSKARKLEQTSRDAFFSFFDNADSPDQAAIRGAWDFAVHVALPLAPYIDSPEDKTVLEIGYGGGRLLLAASRFFRKAIGIDVHDCVDTVANELRGRGAGDFELLVTDGRSIPLEDESVDVVYSFIVLQHVQHVEVLKGYFRETFRVLKRGGVAILYCGRYCRHSRGTSSRLKLLQDRLYESASMRSGYRELPAEVNSVNLIVTRSFCVRLARSAGFELLKVLVSHKKVPDGYGRYGGQHGFVLRKRRST